MPLLQLPGRLVSRSAEPYGSGDLVTVAVDLDAVPRRAAFYKNGVLQAAGAGLLIGG